MTNRVLVFGNVEMSALNYFCLTHDSPYEVIAFTLDQDYIRQDSWFGLPVVPFEKVETIYPPSEYRMSILLGFRDLNRFRERKYSEARKKGYDLISYVSSKAITWQDLDIGENSFVFEGSVVQPFAKIGKNVVVAPGNMIGHHSVIKDHCFLASHNVVLGSVTMEPYCVCGANSTFKDGITIGRECIIGAGSLITEDTPERSVYVCSPAELTGKPSNEVAKLLTWSREVQRRKTGSW